MEILLEIAPETYGPYVVMEDGKLVIYLEVLRALYGMLISALIWYRKWRKDLESTVCCEPNRQRESTDCALSR